MGPRGLKKGLWDIWNGQIGSVDGKIPRGIIFTAPRSSRDPTRVFFNAFINRGNLWQQTGFGKGR